MNNKNIVIFLMLQPVFIHGCGCDCCGIENVQLNYKVFSNANENGVAESFLDNLHTKINDISEEIDNDELFKDLKNKLNKEKLPVGRGEQINSKRLSIANETLIIHYLLQDISTAYGNYIQMIQYNQKNNFKNIFQKFLQVVEIMIMKTLATYISKNNNDGINIDLNENNNFKLSENININNYTQDLTDTIDLRNRVDDLFKATFGKIANDKIKALNNNNDIVVTDIDYLSVTF